jgi:hypothetical protein
MHGGELSPSPYMIAVKPPIVERSLPSLCKLPHLFPA